MSDHDGMDGVLRRQFGIADATGEIATSRISLGSKDMPARMAGAQALQGCLEAVGQSVISRVHAGEQRIAAGLRDLTGIKHRAQRRYLIVAVVGMPAIADIALLLRLLAHLGDHRMTGHCYEEAIYVDRAKALGEPDMLLGRQSLITEEDDAVFAKGV